MLSLFRSFLGTWAARVFFIVLVGSFAMWGVADMIRNVGHDTALATVGDRRIEPQEFEQSFRQQLAQLSRTLGANTEPTPAQRNAVAQQTLERMVIQASIAQEVQRLGLAVPDDAVRQAVFAIPAFRGPAGAFDRATFEQVMRSNNMTEASFLQTMRADLGTQQLVEATFAGVSPPDELFKQIYRFQHETRIAETVTLPFAAAATPSPPTEDDLRHVYENDPAAYTAPAYRRISVALLSPQTVAHDIEVSDADLHAYYDQHKSEYVTPEKRSAEVLIAQDQEAATKLADTWRAGADWAAMQKAATDAGASAANLDDATSTEFPSTELADAVFSAAPNTVVGPVKSAFGWQVLEVTKVTAGSERGFDQVKDEIRNKIAQDRAVDLVYDRANKLEDAISAGTPLDHLSGDLGLAGVSGTLDAHGNTPQGEPAPIPGTQAVRDAIVKAAFAQQKGEAPHMIEGPDQSYFALSVEDETAPKLKPFEEVQDQLRADYNRARRHHEQDEAAAKLMTLANATGSLVEAARTDGLTVQQTPPIVRGAAPPGLAPQLLDPIFGLKKGETTMVETPEGFVLVRLDQIDNPDAANDPAGAATIRQALTRSLQQDVEIVFASALRDREQPRVNRTLLDSVVQ